MIKRTSSHLVFIIFMMFCVVQSVFADFNIKVINESGIAYNNLDLAITAVGFDAMYGRISLGPIASGRGPYYFSNQKCEYLSVPLTGTDISSSLEECNLNLMVVAGPKRTSGTILTGTFLKIVKFPPQSITIYDARFPSRPMWGIQPPNIIITIRGGDSQNSIEAEFN